MRLTHKLLLQNMVQLTHYSCITHVHYYAHSRNVLLSAFKYDNVLLEAQISVLFCDVN